MKKKSLLLILLMVLLAPWAAYAQTFTVYETDGTAYNEYVPFQGYNADGAQHNQMIYPATDLSTDMVGKSITQMVFYIQSWGSSGTTQGNWTVSLGETTATTLSGLDNTTSLTQVYEGQMVYNSEHTTMTITFDDAYTYQGGNLLVDFNHAAAGWRRIYFYGKTVTGASYCYGSQRNFLDKVTFSYETPATCAKPNGLEATLTAGNGSIATMSWTENGTATNWVLEYGTTSDFTGATSVNVSGTPEKPLTGLTAETTYYARVKADCGGGDTSDWSATCEFTPTNARTISVYDDPSTLTTNTSVPLASNNQDYANHSEYIIPAADLASINGTTITSITLYATYSLTTGSTIVYLMEVPEATFSTTSFYGPTTASTIVYEGALTISSTDGMTVEFTNAYDYNGGNLLIGFAKNYTSGYQSGSFRGQNVTGASISGYKSGNTSTYSDVTGTQRDFIPKTTIAYTPYTPVKNLTLSDLSNEGATFTWEAPNSNVQSYKYQYREEGGTWNALTSTTALSVPLTGLTSNTTYEFQVQAIYSDGESAFASKTFTTECDAFSIPYPYGFETADDMDCWETVDCENDITYSLSGYLYNSTNNPYARGEAGGCFGFSSFNGNTEPQYLISPQLSGIAAGLHVEFYYRSLQDNDEETFEVGYSTTDKNITSFTWGTEVLSSGPDYNRFSANYPANVKYVAVKYTTADSYYLFVDDFTFEEAASCLEPTAVTASNITTNSADITWTNGGEETTWDIFVTSDNTVVPDETTTPTHEGITTKPYTLTLSPATTYYVYVRAACSAKETSAWSSPVSFNTDCEGMDLPYGPYGFEDGALTVCWNHYSDNLAYNSASVYNGSTYAHTGDKSLRFYRGSTAGDLVLALPVVDDSYDLSDYQFEFYAYATGTNMMMTIGIMDDPNDLTTFVAQGTEFNPATSYTEYKVRFDGYTGTGKYVAIEVTRSGGSSGSIYMDDIAINPIPSCIEPTGLAVTAPTPHGATFGWTNGGSETEWHLYFGKDATAPADDIPLGKVTVADSNPFTLTTGLDAETEYYVWVRANCGGTDGYSMWVGPKTFTTGVACPAPTGLAASEITNHTAKLSWTGTSESYVLSVGTYDYTATPVMGTVLEEGFESTSMPEGWTHIGNGSAAPSTSYTHASSSRSLEFKGTTSNNVVVLPQFAAEPNQLTIDFWSRAESSTLSNSGYFDLGYVTDASDASTFEILETYSAEDHGSAYVHIENYSLSTVPDGARIAFRHRSGVTYYYWYIDDVTITGPTYPIAWNTYNITDTQKTVEGLLAETPYFAKVKGNCGTEGYSQETAVISFTTDIPCPAPTGLTASNPKSNSFDLQWTNGGAEDWVLAYKVDGAADFTELDLNVSDVTEEAGTISYTLSGLDPETDYIVKVRDNCEASYAGDGMSEWTAEVPYSTIAACSAMNPVVSDITHHAATVNWEGESASGFTVNYRVAAGDNALFEEGFENGLGSWTFTSMNAVNGIGGSGTNPAGIQSAAAHSNSYGFRLSSYSSKSSGETYDQYLVSPELTVTGTLKFYAKKYSNTSADNLYVGYSTTTSDLDAFTWDVEALDLTGSWKEFTHALPTDVKYFAFHYFGDCAYYVSVDDIAITVPTSAGAWQSQAATGNTADLTGLTAGTKYDVKVVPNCDETLESATVQFTTISDNVKHFLTAGNWNDAANWLDEEMPSIDDEAVLFANANIFGDASAKKITFSGSPTPVLTIENGGTLQTDNTVTATVKKHIVGYGAGNEENKANYYLIANPLNSTVYTSSFATVGLTVGNFDLYSWSYNPLDELEWRNFKVSSFYMYTKTGYLYAHETDTDLAFTGTVAANNTDQTTNLNFATSGTYDFNGWNLVGNPFTCNAFITLNAGDGNPAMAYYRMNSTGTAIEASTDAIKPMEGIFVKATATSQTVKFSRTAPVTDFGNGQLNINVAQVVNSRDAIAETDNAIIRFDGGNTLEKFVFREGRAKLYIPQDETEYAVVASDGQGMMPLNFKVEKTGNYTVSFNGNNVEFSYLHLIDNFTGEDIDLLIEPSYTFMASVRDRENRFIIKFNTIDSNIDSTSDIFAYQNGDEIIVSGEGELQVYDIMGRFVMSSRVNGTERFNASSLSNAVYIFRLVGNEVKTQKIVVK